MDQIAVTNKDFSTTRLVTKEMPNILKKNDDLYEIRLFSEGNENRVDEGGLRKRGDFKSSKSNLPLVSVVTVVFNGEKYLEDTIKSVIGQSYDNVEYIIVDGGSKDGTLDIIKKYDDVIDYWVSEPDKGIYGAMNKGISFCSGEIVKLINADDLMTQDSIKKAVEIYLDNENIEEFFINSFLDIIDTKGNFVKTWEDKNFTKYFPVFFHPSWFVPTKLYKKYGLYDLSYSISADYEYFLRLQSKFVKIITLKKPLAQFRIDGTSSSFEGVFQVYRINKNYFGYPRALYVFLLHGGIKIASKIKNKIIKLN